MDKLRQLFTGEVFNIYAPTNEQGRCRVQEFLSEYAVENPRGQGRLKALLEDIAENGLEDHGIGLFRFVGDGVCEFKERGGLARIWGYIDNERKQVIILVLARLKNPGSGDKSKEESEHIAQAKRRCKQYKAHPLPFEK